HTRFACHRLGEQRLARARRSVEEHTLRDLGAELAELRRRVQELFDLLELLDRLVEAGDVGEGDLRLILRDGLRPGLAEAHGSAAASLYLSEHPHQHEREEYEGKETVEETQPRA